MRYRTRIFYTDTDKSLMWDRWQKGDSMSELLELDVIAKIRHCANTGLVLGTEKFRKQVAVMVEYHLSGPG